MGAMALETKFIRTREAKPSRMREAIDNPIAVIRELNNRSFYHFLEYFWPVVSAHTFQSNWHIKYICEELMKVAERVGTGQSRLYDLVINVPPGSTKTICTSIMFPVWCWTKWYQMRFITASYSGALSLESAEYCRELVRSSAFQQIYPEIEIKDDKDTKSNFRVVKKVVSFYNRKPEILSGGSRYSTSVGGTLTGFHGDILIVDDPLNPSQAASDIELANANRWCEQTLSTRKTNKDVTATIYVMQRLHQDDPAGHLLAKQKENIRHICLPGESVHFKDKINPPELIEFYKDGLFDPMRLPWKVLKDLEADLGQYGYAGQIGQDPTPPGGGMFKVDHFTIINTPPNPIDVAQTVRYWDKAGSVTKDAAFTVGVRMCRLKSGKWVVEDVRRGKWGSHEREAIIKSTAEADGVGVEIWMEQEPGSGGLESAQGSIRNLGGFNVRAERPTGDKAYRADPYSVQVNNDNVLLVKAEWVHSFLEEHRFFPFSTNKDQVDACSGAFAHLVGKKVVRRIT